MTNESMRPLFRDQLSRYLRKACECYNDGDLKSFYLYTGKAEALRSLLTGLCNWDERTEDTDIKTMLKFIDEKWQNSAAAKAATNTRAGNPAQHIKRGG